MDAGGEDAFFERIAGGESLSAIARDLGVERARLSDWVRVDPDRAARLARARAIAAETLVDESLAIIDETATADNQVQVQSAKLRSEVRRWMAGKLDRDMWGEQTAPTVAIQINNLHSGSLRHRGE
jgi:transposase-like protein